MNNDQIFALVLIGVFALVVPIGLIVFLPLAKAWSRKMSARLELEAGPAELEDLRFRMQELEERLGFAERLLADGRDVHHMGKGS
jgi:hypothetical protein